jgi:hypothetical protein
LISGSCCACGADDSTQHNSPAPQLKPARSPHVNLSSYKMKAIFLAALALGLLGVVAAQAVVETYYSDSICSVQAGPELSPALGQNFSNPLVLPIGQCVKYPVMYIKFSSCGGPFASAAIYFDSSCTQKVGDTQMMFGSCQPTQGITGANASKLTAVNCSIPQPQTTQPQTTQPQTTQPQTKSSANKAGCCKLLDPPASDDPATDNPASDKIISCLC